jgi:hypothetical protein
VPTQNSQGETTTPRSCPQPDANDSNQPQFRAKIHSGRWRCPKHQPCLAGNYGDHYGRVHCSVTSATTGHAGTERRPTTATMADGRGSNVKATSEATLLVASPGTREPDGEPSVQWAARAMCTCSHEITTELNDRMLLIAKVMLHCVTIMTE